MHVEKRLRCGVRERKGKKRRKHVVWPSLIQLKCSYVPCIKQKTNQRKLIYLILNIYFRKTNHTQE